MVACKFLQFIHISSSYAESIEVAAKVVADWHDPMSNSHYTQGQKVKGQGHEASQSTASCVIY